MGNKAVVKETYSQLNKRIQEEVNALPIHWAFGEKQWKGLLEKLGIQEEDASEKLMKGPSGSIILKEDKELVVSTLNRHHNELKTALEDVEFFKEAVIYEMGNHEYHINWQGDWDVCTALGFKCECEYEDERDIESTDMTDEQKRAYKEARKEFLRMASENDWY